MELIPYFRARFVLDPALTELKSCERQGPVVGQSRVMGPVLQVRQKQEREGREEGTCCVFVMMETPGVS